MEKEPKLDNQSEEPQEGHRSPEEWKKLEKEADETAEELRLKKRTIAVGAINKSVEFTKQITELHQEQVGRGGPESMGITRKSEGTLRAHLEREIAKKKLENGTKENKLPPEKTDTNKSYA